MNEYKQDDKQNVNTKQDVWENQNGNIEDAGKENTEVEKRGRGFGIAAMILGIFSVLLICIQPFGVVLAVTAIGLGILGVRKVQKKGIATAGIVMGGISLVMGVVILIFFGSIFRHAVRTEDDLTGTAWRKGADGSVLYLYKDGTFIHVDQENDFTDNFYSGTYMVCNYKDSGVHSQEIENTYDTDSVYELKLYVTMYVEDGKEQENISGTMQYIYAFQKNYRKGDVVQVCAHDKEMFGSFYPVVETELKKPTIGNQYIPALTEASSETEEASTDTTITTSASEVLTTDVTTETQQTETSTTEAVTTETPTTETTTTTEASTTEATTTTETPTTEATTMTEASTTEATTTTETPTTETATTTEISTTETATTTETSTTEATTETTEETTTEEATTEEASTEDDEKEEAVRQWFRKLVETIRQWLEDFFQQLGL